MCDAAGGLQDRGYRVKLVARPGSVLLQKAGAGGIDCRPVEMRSDFDPVSIYRLIRLFRSFKPEVVIPNLDREIRLCASALFLAGRLPAG